METIAFWLVEIVGVVVILMGAIVAWVFFCDWLRDKYDEPHVPSYDEGYKQALNRLKSDSWWFSEDTVTMELICNLSTMNVSDAREIWRKARSEKQVAS